MGLLDNFPHKCTIQKRRRENDVLGGARDIVVTVQTGVACWVQAASTTDIDKYEKRGLSVTNKVYFLTDPNVNENNEILLTEINGVTVSDPKVFQVVGRFFPDGTAGMQIMFKIMTNEITSATSTGI